MHTTPQPAAAPASAHPTVRWTEGDQTHTARWQSEAGVAPPQRIVVADDTMSAATAFGLASQGTALLWRGDYHNARQLLQAMARRLDDKAARARRPGKMDGRPSLRDKGKPPASRADLVVAEAARAAAAAPDPATAFNLHRMAQAQRARILGMLLLPFDAGHNLPLGRAPDVRKACNEAYGPANAAYVVSLRELLGVIGAHEWRRKGVEIPTLGERIHPFYGVYSPVRGEYIELVGAAPLPAKTLAFDIGTGTGVLAAVLAKRGVSEVVATDQDPRALACARNNLHRLGLDARIKLLDVDLFPPARAPLIVCNPPWLPARPSAPIERAIYDQGSQMLRGFLGGLATHLEPDGEGWLILSDLAEHLGLRTREELLGWIDAAGLMVVDRADIKPAHRKASDASDPLHAARAAEVTSLWRLRARPVA